MSDPDEFEARANEEFEGPVDAWGKPKISSEALDIEVRFLKDGTAFYRFTLEMGNKSHAVTGPWRVSRSKAYEEGETYVRTGKVYG